MKIEKTSVFGFEASFRAMRNPLESYALSDSAYGVYIADEMPWDKYNIECDEQPRIGPNDRKLAQRLIRNGPEHSKFLRSITVWVDMTLPLYIWSEFDTYKVGVVRNSCSTMHMLGKRALTVNDFEEGEQTAIFWPAFLDIIKNINDMSFFACEKKSAGENVPRPVIQMKKLLPCSYLQKATLTMNYAVLRNMYFQRRYHKLQEWNIKESNPKNSVCKWIETLPYAAELITFGNK